MMSASSPIRAAPPKRVFVVGATGTIGRSTVGALVAEGHDVTCFVRPRPGLDQAPDPAREPNPFAGATVRFGDVTDLASLRDEGFCGERFDVLVSCLASRTGVPADAVAIDHFANSNALEAAIAAGVHHAVLLSAICVQRPLLAFQRAKLAFEAELIASGITYSTVRPTAFFKSLSGQVERVRGGKPYLVFGDGTLTACKPISDGDLARYIARCLTDPDLQNRILPIGGPGAAITPREQAERLFSLLGVPPRIKRVPVSLLKTIGRGIGLFAPVSPAMRRKAELARIGHYYATQSMLVLDPATGRYDETLTPSTGTETLFDHYRALLNGTATTERGDHAVF